LPDIEQYAWHEICNNGYNNTILYCHFNDNTNRTYAENGCGLFLVANNNLIKNCTFINNVIYGTHGQGGGCFIQGNNNQIVNCGFTNNRVIPHGGYYYTPSDGTIHWQTVYAYGGALCINYGNTLTGCTFSGNLTGLVPPWGGSTGYGFNDVYWYN
jgi:hypothetical protein